MSFRLHFKTGWTAPRLLSAALVLFLLAACGGNTSATTASGGLDAGGVTPALEVQHSPASRLTASEMPTARASPVPGEPGASGSPAQSPTRPVSTASATATVFRLPSVTPTSTLAPLQSTPGPTPGCIAGLTFLEDLTVPDGTVVGPGAAVDKRWRVSNSGSCNWDVRYRLRLIAGDGLGHGADQALYPARSGTQAVIRMLLTAPGDPGTYRSAWQAVDAAGALFGDPIFVEITVPSAAPGG